MKIRAFSILLMVFGWTLCAQNTHIINWTSGSKDLEATLKIEVGDTVRWVFGEYSPQNLINTSFGAPSDFGINQHMSRGSVYAYVFTKPGVYTFESSAKQSLNGSIKVVDSGSARVQGREEFKIYPNPVRDRLFFESPGKNKVLDLIFYDILGKKVREDQISSSIAANGLDVSSLKRGVYLVQIEDGTRSFTQKLVKE